MMGVFLTFFLIFTVTSFVGYSIAAFPGFLAAVLISSALLYLSTSKSTGIVMRIYRMRPLLDEKVSEMVKTLSVEAKIKEPRVYEVPSSIPDAFAIGKKGKAMIAVTNGLLELNDDEIKSVLAHLICTIKNGYVFEMSVSAALAELLSYPAQVFYWRFIFGGRRRGVKGTVALPLIFVVATVVSLLIRVAVSGRNYFRSDYDAALLVKHPISLARALRKIEDVVSKNPISFGFASSSCIWVVNPFKRDWFTGMFSPHPSTEKRVKRLEEMVG